MTVLNTGTREGHRYLALLEEMGLGDESPMSGSDQSNAGRSSTTGEPNNGSTGEARRP
jgi:hypothetical protein